MILKNFPSIKFRSEKVTGIIFSVLNLFFWVRLIWQLFNTVLHRNTILLLGFVLVFQILFIIAGFQKKLFQGILSLIHLTGSPFLIFFVFIFVKRLLKSMLVDQPLNIRVEIGTWYLAIFLFLAFVIIINFFRDLSFRVIETLPESDRDQFQSKFIKYGHFLIIFLIVGYWIYTQAINPLPIYSNYDPEFTYMLNSLTPFKDLELYGRMDHPGTFLQIAGSLFVIVLSPLSIINDGYPYTYHINHPEAFIYSARFLILLVNISTIRLIYRYFKFPNTWSVSLAGVSALIVYFSTHKDSFSYLANWSPNSFNFAVGTFLLVILYILVTSGRYKDPRSLWMISIAIGLGATFHIYMVSLILCMVSAIFFSSLFEGNHWKDTLKYAALSTFGAIAGYLTGTLVIAEHYKSFIRWIIKVISHQGSYGAGISGFVSITDFYQNLILLWNRNSTVFIFWLISVLFFIIIYVIQKKDTKLKAPIWAFIIGINIQIISLLVMFGKQPGTRYLLSISALFPLVIISISGLIDNQSKSFTVLMSVLFTGLVILLFTNFNKSIIKHHETRTYFLEYQNEVNAFKNDQLIESGLNSDDITYYWTYNTLSLCYSLWLGNDFSELKLAEEILNQCPQDLQYDIWKNSLNDLWTLKEINRLNILIVNDRNFDLIDDLDYINKVESSIPNLGFIQIR